MFEFKKLKMVELEITNKCQASCPMCIRNIHGGVDNPYLKTNEWTLDDFTTIFNEELVHQIEEFFFCGSFGDPVLNDDLIEMCKYITLKNPTAIVKIHTNGSLRKPDWWKTLASVLPNNHEVVFALDGATQETHSLYRTGTSFDKIILNAKEFIKGGGKASWNFLRFKHNEHEVEQARSMSLDIGFEKFAVKDTRRFVTNKFPVVDKKGKFSYNLEPWSGSLVAPVNKSRVEELSNKWINDTNISCHALDAKSLYIDAHFTAVPCCIMASFLYVNYDIDLYKKYNLYDENNSVNESGDRVKNQLHNIIEKYFGGIGSLNAKTVGLKNIVTADNWQNTWSELWASNGSMVCGLMCSKSSPFIPMNDQTVKIIKIVS